MSPRHIPPGKEDLWRRQEEIDAEYEQVSRDLDAADRHARRLYEEFGEDSITEEADEEVARLFDRINEVTEISNRVYMERTAGLSWGIDHDPTAPVCGGCQGAGCSACNGWGREYREPIAVWNVSAQAWIDPSTGRETDILGDGSDRLPRSSRSPGLPPTATPDIPSPIGGTEMRMPKPGTQAWKDLLAAVLFSNDADKKAWAAKLAEANEEGDEVGRQRTVNEMRERGQQEQEEREDLRERLREMDDEDLDLEKHNTGVLREMAEDKGDTERAARIGRDYDDHVAEQRRRAEGGQREQSEPRCELCGSRDHTSAHCCLNPDREKPHPTTTEYMAAVDAWLTSGGSLGKFDELWAKYMDGTGEAPTPDDIDPADKQREHDQMQREENDREKREEREREHRDDREQQDAGLDHHLPWWFPADTSNLSFNEASDIAIRAGNLRDYMVSLGDPPERIAWANWLYQRGLDAQQEAGERMDQRRREREARTKQPPTGGGQGGTGMSELENARATIMGGKQDGETALAELGSAAHNMEDARDKLRQGAQGSNQAAAEPAAAQIEEGLNKLGEAQQLFAQALQDFEGVAQGL